MQTIKILLVDDHEIMREGLRSLIESQKNMEIIGEAENGSVAIQKANELKPDVIIMDISMPVLNGIEASAQIHNDLPNSKIIAVTMYSDKRFLREMLKAGASGLLPKECAFEELVKAINCVVANQTYISPRFEKSLGGTIDENKKYAALNFAAAVLTKREKETLKHIAEGASVQQISLKMGVTVKTIEAFRKHIKQKLNISSVANLTKFAIREGFTKLNG